MLGATRLCGLERGQPDAVAFAPGDLDVVFGVEDGEVERGSGCDEIGDALACTPGVGDVGNDFGLEVGVAIERGEERWNDAFDGVGVHQGG